MEKLFVIALSLIFTVLNSLHVIIQLVSNRPDQVFTGIAHSVEDYFLYVDVMAQGAAGRLTAATHFTNETLPPMMFYWFNTILGWLGHLVGLSPFATYNVAVILLVFSLCLLWYKLCSLIFPNDRPARLTAFLFILTASSFVDPKGFFADGRLDLLFPFWFSPTPAFNRLGNVPHQIFQTILIILLIIVYCKKNIRFSILHSLFLVLITFITALINPIQLLLVMAAAILTTLWKKTHRIHCLLLVAVAVPSLLLSKLTLSHPIIASANAWEAWQFQQIPPIQLLVAIGPVAILALFGFIPFLRRLTIIRLMFLSYGLLSFAAFYSPLYRITGTAVARFLHPAAYGILGILGAEGVSQVSRVMHHVSRKQISFVIWHLSFIILYLILTLPALYSQINARTNPALQTISSATLTSNLNHVPGPVVDALTWLASQEQVLRSYSVVLTDPVLPYDVLVPVFTGKISFTGHPIHTLYPDVKEDLRQQFFNGKMNEDEAKQFLTNHRIGFALSNRASLPFATKVFSNDSINVFAF